MVALLWDLFPERAPPLGPLPSVHWSLSRFGRILWPKQERREGSDRGSLLRWVGSGGDVGTMRRAARGDMDWSGGSYHCSVSCFFCGPSECLCCLVMARITSRTRCAKAAARGWMAGAVPVVRKAMLAGGKQVADPGARTFHVGGGRQTSVWRLPAAICGNRS